MGLSQTIQLISVYNATLQGASNVKPKQLVLFVIKVYNSTKKEIYALSVHQRANHAYLILKHAYHVKLVFI